MLASSLLTCISSSDNAGLACSNQEKTSSFRDASFGASVIRFAIGLGDFVCVGASLFVFAFVAAEVG